MTLRLDALVAVIVGELGLSAGGLLVPGEPCTRAVLTFGGGGFRNLLAPIRRLR